MSRVVLVVSLLLGAARARADAVAGVVEPVRIAIECQEAGRTKACPAFLRGLVDEHRVLLASPRAGADLVIYATATTIGQLDRMHLRFVGQGNGMPSPV